VVNAYFLDSSALVKRYVAETGTAWLQTIMASTFTLEPCSTQRRRPSVPQPVVDCHSRQQALPPPCCETWSRRRDYHFNRWTTRLSLRAGLRAEGSKQRPASILLKQARR